MSYTSLKLARNDMFNKPHESFLKEFPMNALRNFGMDFIRQCIGVERIMDWLSDGSLKINQCLDETLFNNMAIGTSEVLPMELIKVVFLFLC